MAGKGSGRQSRTATETAPETAGDDSGIGLLFWPSEDREPEWRNARVRVLREDDKLKTWTFHGYLPIDEAGPSLVIETFGGGKYMVQVVASDNEGKEAIRKTQRHRFPGPYKVPMKVPGVGDGPASSPPGVQDVANFQAAGQRISFNDALNTVLVDRVLDVVQRSQEASRAPRSEAPVWLDTLVKVGLPLLEKIVERKPDDTERTRLLDELRDLKQEIAAMKNAPGPAASGIKDAVEAVKSLIGVKNLLEGNEPPDPDSMMWSGFTKLVEAATSQKQPAALPPGQPGPAPGQPMPLWQQMLVRNKAYLLGAAMQGKDPEDMADLAVRFLPSNLAGVAVEFVQQPNAFDLIVQVIPELQQFPAWTVGFLDAFRGLLLDTGEDASEDPQGVEPGQ